MSEHVQERPVVIVTGSTGLIGTRVVENLADDYRVVGLDIERPEAEDSYAKWHRCDLTKDESVAEILRAVREDFGGSIASVVHLAAYYDFSGAPSPMYDKLTVEGTRRLIKGLRDHFDSVGQFIFTSSLLVMEPVDEKSDVLTEESSTEAEWAYPASKLRAEAVLRDEHGDIPTVVLRLAGAYDDGCHSLPLSRHIRRINEKHLESYVFPGDADRGQPFVHLDDVQDCIRATIEARSALNPFETFLIAEPEVLSYNNLQETLGELIHGKEWPTVRIPKAIAKAGAAAKDKLPGDSEPFIKPWMIDLADDHYPVAIDRARKRLEWEPRHRLRDTLPVMVEDMRRDPYAWYEKHDLPVPDDLAKR